MLVQAIESSIESIAVGDKLGLDARVITALLKDHRGILWIGSRDGLYRFDGYRSKRFVPKMTDPFAISDGEIRSIFESKDKTLWIATNSGGLNRFDPITEKFTVFRHNPTDPQSLSHDSIYHIVEDNKNRLWVATQIGLNLFDPTTGKAERFFSSPKLKNSLSSDYVHALHLSPSTEIGKSDTLWAATLNGGISRWRPKTNDFERFELAQLTDGDPARNDVFAFAETQEALWLGSRKGLLRLNLNNNQVSIVPYENKQPLITAIKVLDDKRLLIGTLNYGLLIYYIQSQQWTSVKVRAEGKGQQLNIAVFSLEKIGERIFIGTMANGLLKVNLIEQIFSLTSKSNNNNLPLDNITALWADEKTGNIWLGSFGGGVQWFNTHSQQVERLPLDKDHVWPFGVLAIVPFASDQVVVATIEGLWRINKVGTQRQLFPFNNQFDKDYLTSLTRSSDGGIWIGTGGHGLFLLDTNEKLTALASKKLPEQSLANKYITDILQLSSRTLLVGTRSDGLHHCQIKPWYCHSLNSDGKQDRYKFTFHHVTNLFKDSKNRVWVGTHGGGLSKIDFDHKGNISEIENWDRAKGLLSNTIMAIMEDKSGTLWLTSKKGLTKFNPDNYHVINIVRNSGLPEDNFNARSVANIDNQLFFGTINGLLSVSGDDKIHSQKADALVITAVEVSGVSLYAINESKLKPRFEISYKDSLSLEFALLDYSETPHEYQYRFAKHEQWVTLDNRNRLNFFAIVAGEHSLLIRGRDAFGRWQYAIPFNIIVTPPYWQTIWFNSLVAALTMMILLFIHRYRVRKLRRRNQILKRLKQEKEDAYQGLKLLNMRLQKAKEEERQHLSRELHDELGQNLVATKINLQILLPQVSKIGLSQNQIEQRITDSISILNKMIKQVRTISLTLRPPLLNEAGLIPALQYFIVGLQERFGVHIALSVKLDLPVNSPDTKILVFRIIQEALNNALQHAKAQFIQVQIYALVGNLHIDICDDGCGFDLDRVEKAINKGQHLGLLGIRQRVNNIGGQVHIVTTIKRGTQIRVNIPT